FATISAGKLTIVGTLGVDGIDLQLANNTFTIIRSGASMTLPASGVTNIEIYAYDGDDAITIGPGIIGCYVDAGAGNDFVQGGDDRMYARNSLADTLFGGAGTDHAQIDNGLDSVTTIEDILP